ncbi:MAG: hypothetical protein EXS08_05315 [Planctomycetes bacterium]|nr:hypothetical protein [Planctomycetota bacterium]
MIKTFLGWTLSGLCLLASSGCIYVRVSGDLDDHNWGDGSDDEVGFHGLRTAVEGLLVDPDFDLKVTATPWKSEARWTVAYVETGSDPEAAFLRVQEAVRQRVQDGGGHLTGETKRETAASFTDAGTARAAQHLEWSCDFHLDGEPGSASIEFEDRAGDEHRSKELVLSWIEDD